MDEYGLKSVFLYLHEVHRMARGIRSENILRLHSRRRSLQSTLIWGRHGTDGFLSGGETYFRREETRLRSGKNRVRLGQTCLRRRDDCLHDGNEWVGLGEDHFRTQNSRLGLLNDCFRLGNDLLRDKENCRNWVWR